MVLVWVR